MLLHFVIQNDEESVVCILFIFVVEFVVVKVSHVLHPGHLRWATRLTSEFLGRPHVFSVRLRTSLQISDFLGVSRKRPPLRKKRS